METAKTLLLFSLVLFCIYAQHKAESELENRRLNERRLHSGAPASVLNEIDSVILRGHIYYSTKIPYSSN